MATTIGLRDFRFAPLLTDTKGLDGKYNITYGPIVPIVGLRNATIDVETNSVDIVGDDRIMDTIMEAKSINLTVETVDLPNHIRAMLQGQTVSMVNGVITVNTDDKPIDVAVGFKSQKRNKTGFRRVWLLKGKLQPISDSYQTKGDTIEPKYNNLTFRFIPRMDQLLQFISDSDDAGAVNDATFFNVTNLTNVTP